MRTLLCFCLIPAIGYSADPPVKPNAKVAWAWASSHAEEYCPGPNCKVSVAWLWATVHTEDPPAKDSPADCHCGHDCGCGKGTKCECTQAKCYGQLRGRAVREGKPLIVGVGCEPPEVSGVLRCRYDDFAGVKAPAIVIGKPQGKDLIQAGVLDCKAGDATIKAVLNPPAPLTVSR